jgi:hypothetical protein
MIDMGPLTHLKCYLRFSGKVYFFYIHDESTRTTNDKGTGSKQLRMAELGTAAIGAGAALGVAAYAAAAGFVSRHENSFVYISISLLYLFVVPYAIHDNATGEQGP